MKKSAEKALNRSNFFEAEFVSKSLEHLSGGT